MGREKRFCLCADQQFVAATARARWQEEAFHRGFRQLTGVEKYPCRKASVQRNHLTCCCPAWVSLRQFARLTAQIICQAHQQQGVSYLRQLLQNPFTPALLPASA